MKPELYMWSGVREMLLARHDFYLEQVKIRVLSNFNNMQKEADQVANEVYERIGQSVSDDYDMSQAADTALEHGLEFYELLSNMKIQTTLGALASLYHQWDKDLRDFIERELSRSYDHQQVSELCWQPNVGKVFEVLEKFGWAVRKAKWFPLVDACRLIANVYKHGKGRSLDELADKYPQYLKGPFADNDPAPWLSTANHEDLSVNDEEFEEIAAALRQFWEDFPEHSYLKSG